jgi:hypothetical protein
MHDLWVILEPRDGQTPLLVVEPHFQFTKAMSMMRAKLRMQIGLNDTTKLPTDIWMHTAQGYGPAGR